MNKNKYAIFYWIFVTILAFELIMILLTLQPTTMGYTSVWFDTFLLTLIIALAIYKENRKVK